MLSLNLWVGIFGSLFLFVLPFEAKADPAVIPPSIDVYCKARQKNEHEDYKVCADEMLHPKPEKQNEFGTSNGSTYDVDDCVDKPELPTNRGNQYIVCNPKGGAQTAGLKAGAKANDTGADGTAAKKQQVAKLEGALTDEENRVIEKAEAQLKQGSGSGISGASSSPGAATPAAAAANAKVKAAKLQLLQKAKQAVKEDKPFPKELAQQTSDPQLQEQLSFVSDAQDAKPQLAQEDDRLTAQLAGLLQAAASAAALAEKMGASGSNASAIPGSSSASGISSDSSSSGTAADSDTTGKNGNRSLSSEAVSAANGLDPEDIPQPGDSEEIKAQKAARALSKSVLRAKLDDYLKGGGSGGTYVPDSLASAQFTGEVPPGDEAIRGMNSSEKTPGNGAFDFAASMLPASVRNGFSMRASETEAEVKRLVSEVADGGEQAALQTARAGILGVKSSDLFQRVTTTYSSCVRKGLVLGQILAKPRT